MPELNEMTPTARYRLIDVTSAEFEHMDYRAWGTGLETDNVRQILQYNA